MTKNSSKNGMGTNEWIGLSALLFSVGLFLVVSVIASLRAMGWELAEQFGPAGDFFAGFANPVLSFVVIILLLIQNRTMRQQLVQTYEEMSKTTEATKRQAAATEEANLINKRANELAASANQVNALLASRTIEQSMNDSIQTMFSIMSEEDPKNSKEFWDSMLQDDGELKAASYSVAKDLDWSLFHVELAMTETLRAVCSTQATKINFEDPIDDFKRRMEFLSPLFKDMPKFPDRADETVDRSAALLKSAAARSKRIDGWILDLERIHDGNIHFPEGRAGVRVI